MAICRIFFIKTIMQIKSFFVNKKGTLQNFGVYYVHKKVALIECLRILIFTNLQTIYKKHLNFNNLKIIKDMKTMQINSRKEALNFVFQNSPCISIRFDKRRKEVKQILSFVSFEKNKGNRSKENETVYQ